MHLRTELAIIHHNYNQHAEAEQHRQIVSTTSQYSRVADKIVEKNKKTQVQVEWMKTIVEAVGQARRTQFAMDNEPDANDELEDEHANVDQYGFEEEFEQWMQDEEMLAEED